MQKVKLDQNKIRQGIHKGFFVSSKGIPCLMSNEQLANAKVNNYEYWLVSPANTGGYVRLLGTKSIVHDIPTELWPDILVMPGFNSLE